jgi:hypothetical protein
VRCQVSRAAITGRDERLWASSDIAGSRQAGFDEHLVKPVDFNLLVMALRGPALN